MVSRTGVNGYLENLQFLPEEIITREVKEVARFPVPEIWTELVRLCPSVELYPGERPKNMSNVIHELLSWLACKDADWDANIPCYQQGSNEGDVVDNEAIEAMKEFFDKNVSEQSIEVLRKIMF